ncbi:MAG: GNAT family N-acetyltransferase [Salinivirgaceae bacterium]|nr:GNAT family N-acetyltransferase [Salinivirgaceae bacterium]
MDNKQIYKNLCEQHTDISLFSQYWWIDAIAGNRKWDVIIARNDQGSIIATMPYVIGKKSLFTYVLQPTLLQCYQLHFFYPQNSTCEQKQLLKTQAINNILEQIETLKLSVFEQNFDSQFDNCDAFLSKGYRIKTRITYIIENINALDKVFAEFSTSKQRQIRNAEKQLSTSINSITADEFYNLHCQFLAKRNRKSELNRQVFVNLCQQAIVRNQGEIICVNDSEGNINACLFYVWDKTTAYFLTPIYNPTYSKSGASALMVWEAIKRVSNKVQTFDFEGSMDEGIANFYQKFGSKAKQYVQVQKTWSKAMKIALGLKRWRKR